MSVRACVAVALCAWALLLEPALAQDQLSVSIGARSFYNRASGVSHVLIDPETAGYANLNTSSSNRWSLLPSIAVRYGSLSLSGTYHMPSTYSAEYDSSPPDRFKRSEWDLGVGYSPLPNITLSAGYKHLSVDVVRDTELSVRAADIAMKGPFLGLSFAAPLAGDLSLYGTFAVGRVSYRIDRITVARGGQYLATELGVRYALSALSTPSTSTSLLLGARWQSFRFQSVPYLDTTYLLFGEPPRPDRESVRHGIEGITLGIAVSF